jgi:hypothetical protein
MFVGQYQMCITCPSKNQDLPSDRFWPILLKKSTMVSTTEKYALEIEIFTLNRGIRVQISRSGARERRFQRSVCEQSGSTDFFNRIDCGFNRLLLRASNTVRGTSNRAVGLMSINNARQIAGHFHS